METTKDTKHNWFDVKASIRTNKQMTTTEFDRLLNSFIESNDWELLGTIKYSTLKDEDHL